MISKIEVSFAMPVELTQGEMMRIDQIVNDAARRTETPEIVHWAAGCGSKPLWREPLEPNWDDAVFYIETCARERYDTEPFKPHEKRKTNADRFCELLEAIDGRCMAADGPVTPTLTEATSDELRKLYLFADRIRKETK